MQLLTQQLTKLEMGFAKSYLAHQDIQSLESIGLVLLKNNIAL